MVLLQQCTIEKRHYRKGWFIAHTNKAEGIISSKNREIPDNTIRNRRYTETCRAVKTDTLFKNNTSLPAPVYHSNDDLPKKNKNAYNINKVKASSKPNLKQIFAGERKPDPYGNSTGSVIAYRMAIGIFLMLIAGLTMAVIGLSTGGMLLDYAALVLFVIFLSGWLFVLVIRILTKKDAKEQKARLGKTNLFKMLFSGEFKRSKALFAQKITRLFFTIYLILVFIATLVFILFQNA